jgi:hypothetical protein
LAKTKEVLLEEAQRIFLTLEREHGLTLPEVVKILIYRKTDEKDNTIPISIFQNKSLSSLEAIVKYCKEELKLNYKEISTLLYRNNQPIAITYRNAKRKMPGALNTLSKEKLPLEIFKNTHLSVLENITQYLKETKSMSFHEIAAALKRDDRTIWTVYKRAKHKNEKI